METRRPPVMRRSALLFTSGVRGVWDQSEMEIRSDRDVRRKRREAIEVMRTRLL
jgi:hypothetical protein